MKLPDICYVPQMTEEEIEKENEGSLERELEWLNRWQEQQKQRAIPNDVLMTVEEVADRLRCKVGQVYSLTRQRRKNRGLLPLPHRKVGRRLMFVWQDVLEWLNNQRPESEGTK